MPGLDCPPDKCQYLKHSPKTIEGWQAWDIVCKTSSQISQTFPIDTALKLAEILGYAPEAMAELLPEAAIGTALAINDSNP